MSNSAAPFHNRTAILVGGGSGIGLEVARQYIAGGGSVVLGGRSAQRLSDAASALGSSATWRVVDTSDSQSVADFMAPVHRVDAVLTTAATYVTGAMRDLSEADARTPFESKFWGQFRVVRAVLDRLSPDAAIVLMSGAASVRPAGPAAAYVAANAAIEGLARGLAVELSPVRVNAIAPGTIDGHLWGNRPQEIRAQAFDHARRATLVGRPGTEAEVAAAVIHLFSNTYMTGSTIYVDGGYTLR